MNDRKILLIDYDSTSISRTATPLTKAGYDVEVAKDGLSGLAAFERWNPALVLVEAMLPRKHGFEVCQEIKSKPHGKSTPVLITSAVCRGRKYRADAMETYGCDDYIEKPIAAAKLVSMVARLIEAAKQAREEIQQDLSDAIDAVAASDTPPAIESMSDDEIDASIDALVLGGDSPADTKEILTPPPLETVEPPVAELAETPDPVFDVETEMERRLRAMVEVDPPKAHTPIGSGSPPIEPAPVQTIVAEVPAAEMEEPVEPRIDEAVDVVAERTEKKGRSKALPFAMAALAAVVLLVFLSFQFGWIGGNASPQPTSAAEGDFARRAPRAEPAPESTPPLNPTPAVPEVAVETAPVAVQAQPEPVEAPSRKPVIPPRPTFKRRSAEELQAAKDNQAQAEQALLAVAGALQTQLLSEQAGELPVTGEDAIAAVDIGAGDLIGTPVRPGALRGEMFDIGDVDRTPVPVKFEQPIYDPLALRLRQQGVVVVEVLIDETGQVVEARLTQEIPRSRLNDAALRSARRWVYQPAVKDGVPVRVWKTERISFELK